MIKSYPKDFFDITPVYHSKKSNKNEEIDYSKYGELPIIGKKLEFKEDLNRLDEDLFLDALMVTEFIRSFGEVLHPKKKSPSFGNL